MHLGEHLDRANLVAPMANAERLIPYLEQLLRYPFHIGRDLLLDFFFRGLNSAFSFLAMKKSPTPTLEKCAVMRCALWSFRLQQFGNVRYLEF